jgi:hypothetical protein
VAEAREGRRRQRCNRHPVKVGGVDGGGALGIGGAPTLNNQPSCRVGNVIASADENKDRKGWCCRWQLLNNNQPGDHTTIINGGSNGSNES